MINGLLLSGTRGQQLGRERVQTALMQCKGSSERVWTARSTDCQVVKTELLNPGEFRSCYFSSERDKDHLPALLSFFN